jgi:hypothetical protein
VSSPCAPVPVLATVAEPVPAGTPHDSAAADGFELVEEYGSPSFMSASFMSVGGRDRSAANGRTAASGRSASNGRSAANGRAVQA